MVFTYGHQACIYLIKNFIYFKIHIMQCLFQDSLMNKMLNKNSIFFKYNFRNNIHRSKACGQYIYIYFFKEISLYSERIF